MNAFIIPQRVSLIEQTAVVLREWLTARKWSVHLPGELELASQLHVGRNTVRAALQILEGEGRVRTMNGRRRCIVESPSGRMKKGTPVRRAILLMSRPVGEFTPSTALWMTGTQSRVERLGWQFQVCVEPAAFRGRPASLLKSLTLSVPGAVWILHRSTAAMQRWFQDADVKAVLAGTRHEGITLPQVDTDSRAVSRHAAGRFLAHGHRVLAILRPDDAFAGDVESAAGFREGARDAVVQDVQCPSHPTGVMNALRQLLQSSAPPTGLYVLHTEHAVTAISFLSRHGVAVPEAMSVICRDDEPYLALLTPEPTRYRRNPQAMATKIATMVTSHVANAKSIRIMPTTVNGETVAQVSVPKKNR